LLRLRVARLHLTGQPCEALVGLEIPACVAGLPVVLAPRTLEQIELLPSRGDGLGDLARVEALVDGTLELLETLRQIRVRGGRGSGRRALTVKPRRYWPREGTQGQGRQGDRERSAARPPHGSPRLGVKVGEDPRGVRGGRVGHRQFP
jgi:hypothetical protein